MQYKLIRSNRKTIAIIIRDKQVIVRAPQWASIKTINRFVLEKSDWIQEKLDKEFVPGVDHTTRSILLFSENRPLIVNKGPLFSVKVHDIVMVTTPNLNNLDYKIENALKEELYDVIDPMVTKYAKLLNIKKPPFIIRRYKRIYGRCNHKGELGFNLYLFHQDMRFIEYVVLHECAHILEFNHSRKFYDLIKQFMPDYKDVMKLAK